jgi:hypothetical protein
MAVDYPLAQEHFVPRSFMFDTNGHVAIIIHKTGGDATPAAVYDTFLNSGNPGKSSHYAIGQDGSIWQFVPEALGAGANGIPDGTMQAFWQPYVTQYGNLNMCTLSIEHCDPSSNNDTPLTAAQKQASFALVSYLTKKYTIPASHIKPHNSICATDCPGNYPLDELIAYIEQGGTMIPNGWHDDGTTLTAPNDHKVVAGFRDYVLGHSWDPANVPLEEEFHTESVLLHNPSVGAGSAQLFRDGMLWWTASKGVVQEPELGEEINAAYAQIATLKSGMPATTVNLANAITSLHNIQADATAALKDLGVSS